MSEMKIEMTLRWAGSETTITQTSEAFSDEYNEALEFNTQRVADALVELTRYKMKAGEHE